MVEGRIGCVRRNLFTRVPQVATLAEVNALLAGFEQRQDERRIGHRIRTIGQDFAREAEQLLPLPGEAFETGLTSHPRVDRFATIPVKVCRYSVPARLIDRKVTVVARPDEVVVCDGGQQVARHPRLTERGGERLVLDHYLEILLRKPGALAGSKALDQARREGTFTAAHTRPPPWLERWDELLHHTGNKARTKGTP